MKRWMRSRAALPMLAITMAMALWCTPRSALASYSICRTDPIITLSSGSTLTLAADVYADPGQLQDVEYILHVPNGVTVQSVTYDPQYASIEKVTVVSDAQGSRYWATTEADVSSGWAFVQTTGTRLNGTLAKGVGITGWPIFLNL